MNLSSKWIRAALALAIGGCQTVRTEDVPKAPDSSPWDEPPRPTRKDKVDILLVVSNAPGTADLHHDLAAGVPELLRSFAQPDCQDANGVVVLRHGATGVNEDPNGRYGCPEGSRPPFAPIVDIHVGVVSSDMGSQGSDQCTDKSDKGNLVKRAKDARGKDVQIAPIEPSGFLAWYPTSDRHGRNPAPSGPYMDLDRLGAAAAALVRGVGEDGCAQPAPLESLYHFLSDPAPYAVVQVATFKGIDNDVLKQRHDFLRPDSIVAVVLATDADDASLDPGSDGGRGYAFGSAVFPAASPWADDPARTRPLSLGGGTTAPRATGACAKDPASSACASCVRPCGPGALCLDITPACTPPYFAPEDDALPVRFHRMKARYGVEPRFPVARYVSGLRGRVLGAAACRNPLFAKALPVAAEAVAGGRFLASDENGPMRDDLGRTLDVCDLPGGTRAPEDVLLLAITGVPADLAPDDGSEAPWVRVLGRDPSRFDESGLDPRMIASTQPRPGRKDDGDPPDWDTGRASLQYACTFPVDPERVERYRTGPDYACADGSNAPLCDGPPTATQRNRVRGRAFPSPRPLWLARELGAQARIASACPRFPAAPQDGFAPSLGAFARLVGAVLSKQ
jgi:hypothetical protein